MLAEQAKYAYEQGAIEAITDNEIVSAALKSLKENLVSAKLQYKGVDLVPKGGVIKLSGPYKLKSKSEKVLIKRPLGAS